MNNKNIDQLFKKVLEEQRNEPPEYVWSNIEHHLKNQKRLLNAWWIRSLAAAVLIAALLGIWQLYYTEKETEQVMAKLNIPTFNDNYPDEHLFAETEKQISPSSLIPKDFINRKDTEKIDSIRNFERTVISAPIAILHHEPQAISRKNLPDFSLKQTANFNMIPLTSKEALKNNRQYQELLQENLHKKEDKNSISFAISGHFTPAYSSGNYSSSVRSTRGSAYSKDQMEGLMNTGGGIKLAINKGKHLSFQTGIFYSRMGQRTTENYGMPRIAASLAVSANRSVATPLGNIKSHRKAVGFRSSQAIVLNSIAATQEETLKQVFGTLAVPLYVRYKLNDHKVIFSLTGGFSGNLIVNNKVYLKSGNNKELLGSTEGIRKFNVSTDWGLGMEYPLGRKIKVMIEPGFKYYLQSLSRNNDIDFKPYLFTLSTGIGIEF